ncbi:hypothetical protein PV325_008413 [Microctonus aethiopoides]|uniref:Ig-like domain-containing protein n=1 Tax=Microctonus aethiopoides TaxID=144406 RepID=A0AA39KXM0_9HYME|nr:hypothetical protein PV325_008413 [Microctonus aethiopoides]KAK0177371.1 hypothetical protein PV328_001433 [Microctonus aethiopoides]
MNYFSGFFSTYLILTINLLQGINGIIPWPHEAEAKLQIRPQFDSRMGSNLILKKKDESLNLTCTVVLERGDKNDTLLDYILDWRPSIDEEKVRNVVKGQDRNIAWLWFDRLSENHTGNYTCSDTSGKPLDAINIYLAVKKKMTFCGSQWFKCRSKHCIMERYVCDGKNDCRDGEDESIDAGCGPDPCSGKVICEDRCVPPEWCCGHRNCSASFEFRPWQPDTHEINYVQTALYHTVVGWAMAFMFIITLLLIAICRVHIKKAMGLRWWQQNRNINSQAEQNLTHGMNIMYNFSSGVQFIGRTVDPPSYLEVISTPSWEGPPPTYESCQDIINQTIHTRIMPEMVTPNQTDIPLMASSSYDSCQNKDTINVPGTFQDIQDIQKFPVTIASTSIVTDHNNSDDCSDILNLTTADQSQS